MYKGINRNPVCLILFFSVAVNIVITPFYTSVENYQSRYSKLNTQSKPIMNHIKNTYILQANRI